MKTAIIYARVSDPSQAEEEVSIPSQVERGRALAGELGAEVVHVFMDKGKSGRSDTRDGFRAAVSHCESLPTDYFITWSTSRFARNRIDAALYKLRLDKAGTEIRYVSQPMNRDDDTGWVTESMFEIFDELQSRITSKDTRRSMESNARNGFWNGGAVPYGYQSIADPDQPKRRRLIPHEDEAAIVRRMFDMRIAGAGAQTIAWRMNEDSVTNRGRRWNKASVLHVLRSESAIGRIVFGRRSGRTKRVQPRDRWIVVDSHTPIVDPKKFETVQVMLTGADMSRGASSARSGFVFTGMIRCGRCGGAMTTSSAKGRSKIYHYYDCRNAIERRGCSTRRIPAEKLDQWLIERMTDRIFQADRLGDLARQLQASALDWQAEQKRQRAAIARRVNDASGRRSRLYEILELHGKNAPNLGDLAARIRELNERIRAAERELADLGGAALPPDTSETDLHELATALTAVVRRVADPRKLRQFFGGFVERVTVDSHYASVEFRLDRLFAADAVHSKGEWLPGKALTRTGGIVSRLRFELPEELRRAA